MSITVVIPVRNRLDLTAPLVRSLEGDREYRQLLVYDNGSDDGTAEWLAQQDCTPINAQGWNLHQMWNDGILRSEGDAVVFLNNDLVLHGRNWLTRLVEPMMRRRFAAVSPNYDERTDLLGREIMAVKGMCADRYDGTGGLAGFAFAVHPNVLSDYRFPEELQWWCGDADLELTLDKFGHPRGIVMSVRAVHINGGSQTAKSHDLDEVCLKDREWIRAKWPNVRFEGHHAPVS